MRYILALIEVDESMAAEQDMDMMDYFCSEMGWVGQSGISVTDARILDDDVQSEKECLEMANDILLSPATADINTARRYDMQMFKEDVYRCLSEYFDSDQELPDAEIENLFEEFRNRIENTHSFWDNYWNVMRRLIEEKGYVENA